MLHFGAHSMDVMLWQICAHEHLLPSASGLPRTGERYGRRFVKEVEPELKGRLDAAPCICGEHFSAVDWIIGHT
jgi:glutathione S-transferase